MLHFSTVKQFLSVTNLTTPLSKVRKNRLTRMFANFTPLIANFTALDVFGQQRVTDGTDLLQL